MKRGLSRRSCEFLRTNVNAGLPTGSGPRGTFCCTAPAKAELLQDRRDSSEKVAEVFYGTRVALNLLLMAGIDF